jgi:hypothetical protein
MEICVQGVELTGLRMVRCRRSGKRRPLRLHDTQQAFAIDTLPLIALLILMLIGKVNRVTLHFTK